MALEFSDITGAANTAFGIFNAATGAASPYIGLSQGIQSAGAQKTAGIYRQAMYEVQAIDTLSMAQLRADQETKIAALQAGRRLKQAEIQSQNYQIQANNLLRTLSRTNAAVRARAAANGIRVNEGSSANVERANTSLAMFDVGVADLNSLMAKVMGFEDASNMMLAAKDANRINQYAAERQASQLRMAGDFAVKSAGLLANAQMVDTGLKFAQTVTNPFSGVSGFSTNASGSVFNSGFGTGWQYGNQDYGQFF